MRQIITATVIDYNNKIICTKTNNYLKTHPLQAKFANLANKPKNIFLHAEIAAIIGAKNKKIKSIIISRFNKQGQPILAKPCSICELAIKFYQIKHIYHT